MTVQPKPSREQLPPSPPGRSGWPWLVKDRPQPRPAETAAWPRIAVVTPSYNQGQYLEETIRSVLLQDYPNLEYVVVDGGSGDGSVDTIQKYAPWLTSWVSEPDRGQSHAINKGFARTDGEVLGWLNSDDIYLPGTLATVAANLAPRADAALIYGQARHMDQDSVLAGEVLALPFDYQTLITTSNFIPQPSAFFRRSAFAAAGGLNEALHFSMDYDLWLRLGRLGQVLFVPRPLTGMRTYAQSKTGSADRRMFVEVRQMIERHGGHGLPKGFEQWLLRTRVPMAFAAFRRGDPAAGRDELSYIAANVPGWQASPEPLIHEIVKWAWQAAPGLTEADEPVLGFADLVCSHLPSEISAPDFVRRQSLARLTERLSRRSYGRGEFGAARRYAGQALRYDPRPARRRTLLATMARSLAESTAALYRRENNQSGTELRRRVLASLPLELSLPAVDSPLLDVCGLVGIVGLVDGWDTIDTGLSARWATQLKASQDSVTGLSGDCRMLGLDPAVTAQGLVHDAWLTTDLVLDSLAGLGARSERPLTFTHAFKSGPAVHEWLYGLDWEAPEWSVGLDWSHAWLANSAQVMLLASFLIREASRTDDPAFQVAVHTILDWLDDRQDPDSGFWGMSRGLHRIGNTIMAGHFAPLYLCVGRPLRYVERLIDTVLSLQQSNGLFAGPAGPTACATQVAVDLLVKLSRLTDYRAATIRAALTYACRALQRALEASITALSTGRVASEMRPAAVTALASRWLAEDPLASLWLKLSALALISERYPEESAGGLRWQFPPPPALGWHAPPVLQSAPTGP